MISLLSKAEFKQDLYILRFVINNYLLIKENGKMLEQTKNLRNIKNIYKARQVHTDTCSKTVANFM